MQGGRQAAPFNAVQGTYSDILCQTPWGAENNEGAAAGCNALESLFVYQQDSNPERLRTLHIYASCGCLHALLQDFLVSPGGYFLLRRPESKSLAIPSEAAVHVTLQARTFLRQGWRSLLDFSVHLQLPPCLPPLLSPSKNPLLKSLATLFPDLCFVEAVVAKVNQGRLNSTGQSMTDVASTSAKVASQAPPISAGNPFPTCRGFKVPELCTPGTEPEEFSSKHGPSSQAHRAWSADNPRESCLSGAFLPRHSKSAGSEGPDWEQSNLSTLTQAEASACINASPHSSSPLSLETPSPQSEARTSAFPLGSYCSDGPPQSTITRSSTPRSHSAALPLPRPRSLSSVGETCPKPPNRSFAWSKRSSAGIAIPSAYHPEFRPVPRSGDLAIPALSLPPSPFSSALGSGPKKLSLSAPYLGAPAPEHLTTWWPRGSTWPNGAATLASAASAPQPGQWPAREFASLVSKWSAAAAPQQSAVPEQEISGNPNARLATPCTPLKFGSSRALADAWLSDPLLSQGLDQRVAVPGPVQSSPQSSPHSWGTLSQLVTALASPNNQNPTSYAAHQSSSAELSRALPEPSPSTIPGLAKPSTPTPCGLPDPIITAFAALEQGLGRRSLHDVDGAMPDVSPTSSSNSGLDELRATLTVDPFAGGSALAGHTLGVEVNKSERIRQLTRDEVAQYFDLPISEASKRLGVGLTVLKKRCRDMGIHRWPHRKLKSMKTLIDTVQQLGAKDNGGPERQIGSAIQRLEAERHCIEEAPSVKLTQETRKFRQACFKAKYKLRNLAAARTKV